MAKNFFYNLLLTLTNLLFPILSFPYVSRVIGPEGIGKVQFIFSFAQYFALVASIGIPVYGLTEIARYKNNKKERSKVFSELLIIYVVTSVTMTLIYLAVIFTFPYFAPNRQLFLIAALVVFLSFCYIEWLYIGMEEFRSIAVRSVIFKILGLFLMYFFIKDRADFSIYLYIMMFSFLGNNILSLIMIRGKVNLQLSGLSIKRHILPLLLILGSTIATSMYTEMDTVLLGFLSDSKTVGLYTAAVKLSKVIIPFITAMGVVLIPKVSKDFAEHNLVGVQSTLNEIFRFIAFFAIPIVLGLMILAPEFITLFSGVEFLPAVSSMRLLAFLPLIIGFGHLFMNVTLIPSGKNKEMFFSVICGVTVSILLNVLLIPHFKEVGSSIANISSELAVTIAYFYFIKHDFSFTYPWPLLGKSLISCIVFFPAVWLAQHLSEVPLVILLISLAGCIISYLGIQWFIFRNSFILEIITFIKIKLGKI